MQTRTLKVRNSHGVHLRVAGQFVQAAKSFKSRISLYRDSQPADGRSIIQILLLGATKNTELRLVVTGEDEEKAIEQLSETFIDGAGI